MKPGLVYKKAEGYVKPYMLTGWNGPVVITVPVGGKPFLSIPGCEIDPKYRRKWLLWLKKLGLKASWEKDAFRIPRGSKTLAWYELPKKIAEEHHRDVDVSQEFRGNPYEEQCTASCKSSTRIDEQQCKCGCGGIHHARGFLGQYLKSFYGIADPTIVVGPEITKAVWSRIHAA